MRCQMHQIASHAMQQHININAFFWQKILWPGIQCYSGSSIHDKMRISVSKTDPRTNCARFLFLFFCFFCASILLKVDFGHLRALAPNNWRFAQSWGEWTHQRRCHRAGGGTVGRGREKSERSSRITMRQKAPHSGPQQAAASGKHIHTLRSACHRKKKKKAQGGIQNSQQWCESWFYRVDGEKHNVMFLHVCQRDRLRTHGGCWLIWQIKHLLKPVVFESRDGPFTIRGNGNPLKIHHLSVLSIVLLVLTKLFPKSYFVAQGKPSMLLCWCHSAI